MKVYFKIYQDKESMDDSYVCPKEDLDSTIEAFEEHLMEYGGLSHVIEPVLMTEEEYKNLPEFEGF
jgi:hypothetical protein